MAVRVYTEETAGQGFVAPVLRGGKNALVTAAHVLGSEASFRAVVAQAGGVTLRLLG